MTRKKYRGETGGRTRDTADLGGLRVGYNTELSRKTLADAGGIEEIGRRLTLTTPLLEVIHELHDTIGESDRKVQVVRYVARPPALTYISAQAIAGSVFDSKGLLARLRENPEYPKATADRRCLYRPDFHRPLRVARVQGRPGIFGISVGLSGGDAGRALPKEVTAIQGLAERALGHSPLGVNVKLLGAAVLEVHVATGGESWLRRTVNAATPEILQATAKEDGMRFDRVDCIPAQVPGWPPVIEGDFR